MTDNMHGENSQNIHENQEINDPFAITQREIEEMGNFVEAYPFPDPVPNNDNVVENLGLGLGPQQQQLDDQGNEMAVDVAEPILDNPQPLQAAQGQLPAPAMPPRERGVSPIQARAMDLIMSVSLASDLYDAVIIDQAACAMMELLRLTRQKLDPEFEQSFAFYGQNNVKMVIGQPEHYVLPLHVELSRETAVLGINRIGVIELMMDPYMLTTQFPDLVARAAVLREIVPGTVDYDGTIQVMKIQYHMPTPAASTREGYLLRHSKKVSEDTWAVVDLSLEKLFGCAGVSYQRNWSGCTILELPKAHTKVTWLENVNVNNSKHHNMLQKIVGFGFGAKRWTSAFARQWEWMKCPFLRCEYKGKSATPEGARDLLILAERMMQVFFSNASPSPDHNNWITINRAGDIKVAMKPYPDNLEVAVNGRRSMVITTTAPIPVSQKELFEFLCDPHSRAKWDLLVMRRNIQEKLRIQIGDDKDTENNVSVLQCLNERADPTMSYLQRSYIDSTCCYVVSAPIDVPTMNTLLGGTAYPSNIHFLPSGFVVFPDSPSMNGGSLLTVVFQIMDQVLHGNRNGVLSRNSAITIKSILDETVNLIKEEVVRRSNRDRGESSGLSAEEKA